MANTSDTTCSICNKTLASHFSMKRHMEAIHQHNKFDGGATKKAAGDKTMYNNRNNNLQLLNNNNNVPPLYNNTNDTTTSSRIDFWKQMVDETVKDMQRKEGQTISGPPPDEYFENSNFEIFVDNLRNKIFELRELCDAGLKDSVMHAIEATKYEISKKFSTVLSDDEKDQLAWQQWGFVVKKRVLAARKSLYDSEQSDTDSLDD